MRERRLLSLRIARRAGDSSPFWKTSTSIGSTPRLTSAAQSPPASTLPHYQPWEPWRRLFDYELVDVEGGVSFRTQKDAPWEDEQYRLSQDPYRLWAAMTMPVLLVRAAQPIPPDFGFILTSGDYERFLREVPRARGVEIEANHYTVGMNGEAARAIAEFLDASDGSDSSDSPA